ncbi:MAG: hypothetical protein DI618_03935 [Dermacoccus nishinomiyaensis]|nr:hypothetical protein HMPREF0321_2619 [Dermacoccus sp. Ellin185]PZP03000.1 MAG: hypothetical protein DI618_03935 [Dermacoccus nishinomiyaensis]
MTSSTPANSSAATAPTRTFAALVGVASLAVLLQGLWAGLFMSTPDTDPEKTPWLEVHSWCGKAAIGFALLATVWAFLKLRERTDLTFGALALTVLLILEAYLGGAHRGRGQGRHGRRPRPAGDGAHGPGGVAPAAGPKALTPP